MTAGWMLALALFFTLREPAWGKFDPLPTGIVPGIAVLLAGLGFWWVLHRASRSGPVVRWLLRLLVLALVTLCSGMAWTRYRLAREVAALANPWPPRPAQIGTVVLDSLAPGRRAEWGVRIGAHAVLSGGRLTLPIRIPRDWPLPDDVELAVREVSSTEVDVWARVRDGTARCQSIVLKVSLASDTLARHQRCRDRRTAPADLAFARPERSTLPPPLPSVTPSRAVWLQYRSDPRRIGRPGDSTLSGGSDSSQPQGWRVTLDGPIRASASVAGDLVLIGGHGTGSLTALDRAIGAVRWIARAPNWIHQDPVTDGRTVVVGFGDNDGSFAGWAPSGVAAYDLATGTRQWTVFEHGSVMTSPVIHDSVIIYGTGAGEVRRRSLATGALLASAVLPGFVTMAPPVAVGDTIVFTLDHGIACALQMASLDTLWCHSMPELRMLGHSAPTIAERNVLVSGAATILSPTLAEFRQLPRDLQWRLLQSALFPGKYEVYAGQLFAALDLHDGHEVWRSPVFANPRLVDGHTSGTAAIDGADAVIVLPIADTVVAFSPSTGALRWSAGAHAARGPALIVAGHVVVAGRDGVISVRTLVDGTLRCTFRRTVGWDRAGPAVAGDLLIFANLIGEIEAIPIVDLLGCQDRAGTATGR